MTAVKKSLTKELKKVLSDRNYTLQGSTFRRWNSNEDVCSILSVFEASSHYNFSVEVGYYSPVIAEFIGLPQNEAPKISDCNSAGFSFRLEQFKAEKIQSGWKVESSNDLAEISALVTQLIEDNLENLDRLFFSLLDWKTYCYCQLISAPGRRGWWWSLIGYIILSQKEFSPKDFEEAINGHKNETSRTGKLEFHIKKQLEIARKRGLLENSDTYLD